MKTQQKPPEAHKPTPTPAPPAAATKPPEKAPAEPKPNLPMTRAGFEIRNIDEGFRFAQFLAGSTIVPDNYRGKPNDCLVALDLSARLGAPWLAIMQHVYVVHGRVGIDAALGTALTNRSGIFIDPLEFEVVGDDPEGQDYKVRAFARRKSTGTVLYGPWITWKLVIAERWNEDKPTKTGGVQKSKWNTMAEQMFHYRAATWFQRRHCPEVTMGMLTTDEAEDILPAKHVESQVVEPGNEGLKKLLAQRETSVQTQQPQVQSDPETPTETELPPTNEQPEPTAPEEPDAQTAAKVAEQKQKLQTAGAGKGNGKKSNLF